MARSRVRPRRSAPLPAFGDDALVAAIKARDAASLQEAFGRHEGCVFALARRLLVETSLAEEVVQEVFLRLWKDPGRFDPSRGSLRSFLLAEAHGRSVDLLRSETARRAREDRDARRSPTLTVDVDREIEHMETAERVRDAVAALPPGERAAIELAYFGGHTYMEVARLLGEPEGTVKSRIRAGLTRLRDVMENQECRP
ncbi:MAG: sigma-70 family RNA polymerase sigma factor [Acidimicrobiia bacterium]